MNALCKQGAYNKHLGVKAKWLYSWTQSHKKKCAVVILLTSFLSFQNESKIAPLPNKEVNFSPSRSGFGSLLSEEFPRAKEGPPATSYDDPPSRDPKTDSECAWQFLNPVYKFGIIDCAFLLCMSAFLWLWPSSCTVCLLSWASTCILIHICIRSECLHRPQKHAAQAGESGLLAYV